MSDYDKMSVYELIGLAFSCNSSYRYADCQMGCDDWRDADRLADEAEASRQKEAEG